MSDVCSSSHPSFQRRWREWTCPICNSPLTVDYRAADANPRCQRLHSDDQVCCTNPTCLFFQYGNTIARLKITREYARLCMSCRGTGLTITDDGSMTRSICKACHGRCMRPHTPKSRRERSPAKGASKIASDTEQGTPEQPREVDHVQEEV